MSDRIGEECRVCGKFYELTGDEWVAEYQGHIAVDTKRMADAMVAQLDLIKSISASAFLNPRGPGESAADAAQRRQNGGAR